MPRPRKPRFVGAEPRTGFFKPQGIPMRDLESVNLSVEELEAVRLVDDEGLYQEAAAERMEVSRQTFQRVLRDARRKIADALVNGKALGIEGGDYVLAGGRRVFECAECSYSWEVPFGTGGRAREASCPRCGGQVFRSGGGRGRAARGGAGRGRRQGAAGGPRDGGTGKAEGGTGNGSGPRSGVRAGDGWPQSIERPGRNPRDGG